MMKFMLNLNVEKQINLLNNPHKFLILFLILLSVKIVVLFHLLMMEELNSETMILLLSVLISKIVGFVIVQSVKIVLLIFIIVQVLYVIFLFGVNDVIIDCEISNNNVCVKHFVYMISYL